MAVRRFTSVLIAVALGATCAVAQNAGETPPKLPENKRKGKIEFELPSKSADRTKAQPSTPADQVKAALPALAKYPNVEGQEAIERLAVYGAEIAEPVREILKGQEPRAKVAAAQILVRLGDQESVPLFEPAIRDPKGRKQARLLFDALARLDPAKAMDLAFDLAAGSDAPLRPIGLAHLRDKTDATHTARVRALLQSDQEATREQAFQILERLGDPDLVGDACAMLGEGSAALSERALRMVVEQRTPELVRSLNARAFEDPTRQSCWALLALAEIEERWGEEQLTPAAVAVLSPRLKSADPLTRLSAAIALSQLGFRSDDPAMIALTEEKVLPTLVESFLGGTYFKDFSPLFAMARARIRRITGTDPSADLSAWKAAWTGTGTGPRLRRDLPPTALVENADALTIHYRRQRMFGVGRDLDLRFSAAGLIGSADPEVVASAQFVEPERMRALLAALDASGVFGHGRSRKAPTADEKVPARVLRFVAGNRERIVSTTSESDEAFAKVEAALAQVESELGWQRFFVGDRKDFGAFYQREAAGFASCPDDATRERRLLTAMVDALPRLSAEGRHAAVMEFLRRPLLLAQLDEPSIQLVLAGLIDETIPEGAVGLLVTAVARKKDPSLFSPVAGFLGHQFNETGKSLIALLVRELGTLDVALRDDRPLIRLVAVEEGARQSAIGAEALTVLLDDVDPRVRMAAIEALVRSRDAAARARLFELARGEDRVTARFALEALGDDGTGDAFELLKTHALGDEPALAIAAIRGLGRRGGDDGVTVLADVVAKQGATTQLGATALEALCAMRSELGRNWLRARLTGDDVALAEESALRLGAYGELAAVPVLLRILDAPTRAERAMDLLAQMLVCDGGERGEQFTQRYRDEPNVTPLEWFKRALAHERDEPAGTRAVAGIAVARLVEALTDPRWYVRWNAAKLLEGAYGVSLGTPYRYAADEDVARIARRWQGYLAMAAEAGAGT